MNVINLTPHDINLCDPVTKSVIATFPKSGIVPRVTQEGVAIGSLGGAPIIATKYVDLEGVPESQEDTIYLVSSIVLQHPLLAGRSDVIAPDTGPSAIRESGQIVGCVRWVAREDAK